MQRHSFWTGVNYWPADKAMYWWKHFDPAEIERDFRVMSVSRLAIVRIFLTWEDFQPQPDEIAKKALDHLATVVDIANRHGLYLMPTFFCGHMSGVNWFPEWMLENSCSEQRFPVFSDNRLSFRTIKNYFADRNLIEAQKFQISKIINHLKGSDAIIAYDLGNEPSNTVIPPDRSAANNWLQAMTEAIRSIEPERLITLGMHAEDLEEDRHLWPQDAARHCDFLCMHGYPFYLDWVENPLDHKLPAFLGIITRWLGEKPVLFQEFGAPTHPGTDVGVKSTLPGLRCRLWDEEQVSGYYREALRALNREGMLGAMAWCFADYNPSLFSHPPLADNIHERFFGLFGHDGHPKKSAQVFQEYAAAKTTANNNDYPWLDGRERSTFYKNPRHNLKILYESYTKQQGLNNAKDHSGEIINASDLEQ